MRLALAALVALLLVPSSAAAAAPPPPPPGANLPCTPTAARPYPVVLVHGTFENRFNNWQAMSPALKAAGYCVYALNYGSYQGSGLLGIYGVGRIQRSARQLRDFVARVRARTGAARVSLVGHSQGGMMPRYFIKYLGGARVVEDLVGLAPSNHGTTNPLAPSPASPARRAASRSRARRSYETSTRATRRRATSPTRRWSPATTRSWCPTPPASSHRTRT